MKKQNTAQQVLTSKTTGGISLSATAALLTSICAHGHILDETTVLATGFQTGSEETGLRVHVVSGDEMENRGVFRMNNAVLFSPGVNIFSSGGQGTVSS
ncbi:MAG: hypothetical protein ACPGUY_10800, partial [Akkermansiaceae bacterium]